MRGVSHTPRNKCDHARPREHSSLGRGASVTRRETCVTTRDLESKALSVAGRSPRLSHRKRLICKQACDEPFSSATRVVSLVSRRKWDLNPCSAINALLPFQGSPFSLLGISPKNLNHPVTGSYEIKLQHIRMTTFHGGHSMLNTRGECGIRTHGPLRDHWFSRPAPSTTRPTLRTTLKDNNTLFKRCQDIFEFFVKIFKYPNYHHILNTRPS